MVHGIVCSQKEKLSHDIWRGIGTTGNVVLSKIGQKQMSIVCFLSSTEPCIDTHMSVFICLVGLARKGIMREDEAFLGRRGEIDSRWNRCDGKQKRKLSQGRRGHRETNENTV